MTIQWFEVQKADRRVMGWNRSGKAVSILADTAELEFIVATDADLEQFVDLEKQARADGREASVAHISGVLQLLPDTRPLFRVEADKTEVDISAAESVSLTVTRINTDGTTKTGFDSTIRYEIFDKILKFVFVSGVSARTFDPKKSGKVVFQSSTKFKLESSLTITFVE